MSSRCALGYVESRDRFLGGFTFQFFQYRDQNGQLRVNPYRPGIAVKHMDSKRALKGFTGAIDPDKVDQIPEGEHQAQEGLRLSRAHARLCARWPSRSPIAASRSKVPVSSSVSSTASRRSNSMASLRRNTSTTTGATCSPRPSSRAKLLAEYALHPIELQVTKAYSPASIGKAYLQAMGVTPIIARMPDFPKRYCGYAESAFFGGRASAHVRKVPVPVVYTDFMSQYSAR